MCLYFFHLKFLQLSIYPFLFFSPHHTKLNYATTPNLFVVLNKSRFRDTFQKVTVYVNQPSPFLFEAMIYKHFIRAVPLVYNTNWTFPNPVHCHLKFLTWTTLNACLIINTGESIRKNLHNGRSEDFSIHDYLISWFLFLINQLIFSVNVWYTTGTHLKCQPFFKPTLCSCNSFHSRLKCSFQKNDLLWVTA